jgi:urea transport system permease protein
MSILNNSRIRVWGGFALAAIVLFAIAPAVLSDFRLSLLAKFLCFAIVAVGIGLAWGRGGMLTLGQGVFFGIGAYVMAMHLKIADAELKGDAVPDFMSIAGKTELPGYWQPFASPFVAIFAILFLPAAVAFLLGLGVFKRRVKGAYFAILSQALAAAFAILLIGQQSIGGSNGLNRFRTFFGFNLNDPANKQMLFFIAAGVLLASVALIRQLMNSRYGELLVAVRDQEERVRFLGYDPANIKLVAYVTGVPRRYRRCAFRSDRGHHLPRRRRDRSVNRLPHRGRDRWPRNASGSGTRCDRRRLGAVDILGETPFGMDLRTRVDVHRRGRVLPGRCGRIVRPDAPPQEA